MTFFDCKNEEERQKHRDFMLEHMYHQVIAMRSEVCDIQTRVKAIEKKLVYVGATQEERKYLNVDGSLNLDAINDTCDGILALFGDKYIKEDKVENPTPNEVTDNGKIEG